MRTSAAATIAVLILAFSTSVALADEPTPKKQAKLEDTRQRIDAMAAKSLERLFETKPDAKPLYDKAVGYAVIDSTKFALGLSGGGGHGVAVDKATGKKTYMRTGQAGIGFGLGGQNAQVVLFFENADVYKNFINGKWAGGATASATAGKEGGVAETTFNNGVAYWRLSDKGAMLNADIGGAKFWPADKLND